MRSWQREFDDFGAICTAAKASGTFELEYWGRSDDHRDNKDLSDLFEQLATAVSWCEGHVALLASDSSSSKGCGTTTAPAASATDSAGNLWSCKHVWLLQLQRQQLLQGLSLAAAAERWEKVVPHNQLLITGEESCGGFNSWKLFLTARKLLGYQLSKQLQLYAAGLCAVLPTVLCCNNPNCVELNSVSELACVGKRRCSRCQAVAYCSRACQVKHWSQHQTMCAMLCSRP